MNKLNYINIGNNGTFEDSGEFKTSPEDVDTIFKYLTENNITNIPIYIHGGLTDQKDGIRIAKKMKDTFSNDDTHPITFVWQTGFIETIESRILTISDTSYFKKLQIFIIKVLLKKHVLAPDLNKTDIIEDKYIENELKKNEPFSFIDEIYEQSIEGLSYNSIEDLENEIDILVSEIKNEAMQGEEFNLLINSEIDGVLLIKKEFRENINNKISLNKELIFASLGKIVSRIIMRYARKRDHGFKATLIEEILRELYFDKLGELIWNGIKLKAREMWDPNSDLSRKKLHAGRYFLDQLEKYVDKTPEVKINLIVHSAGSVVSCHLLNLIVSENRNCQFENIIFLAPACRVELFNSYIVNNSTRFKTFRMFTMSDKYEINDHLLKNIYPRSLLYLVSGLLENGFDEYILGLERHIRADYPYNNSRELKKAHGFLYASSEGRVVYSMTDDNAPRGSRSDSERHGDFDCDPATLKSLQDIVL